MKDDAQGARRRFLRGSAAAPFVLTVPSGAALARSSAAARCAIQDAAQPDPAFWTTAATESPTWVRREVDAFQVWQIPSNGNCSTTLSGQITAGNSQSKNKPFDAYDRTQEITNADPDSGSTGARAYVRGLRTALGSSAEASGADADAAYYYRLLSPGSSPNTASFAAAPVAHSSPGNVFQMCSTVTLPTKRRMLVSVDTTDGRVRNYTFINASNAQRKITQSCWTSFK